MKKLLLLLSTILLTLGLVACGETSEESLGGKVDSNETDQENDNQTEDEQQGENSDKEINQVIVDNNNLKATLVKIVKKEDDIWGRSVEAVFDVENKRDTSIEVQARSVSVDDRMVDDVLKTMSQEVAPGKSATAILKIEEIDGYEFPEFEKNFEMILHIFSWDDSDYNEQHPVKIQF